MNQLPERWVDAKGADFFELVRGVSYDKAAIKSETAAGFIPVLRANNIDAGSLNRSELVFAPERFVSQHQLLRPGDMVIASSSGSRSVVGKGAMVPDGIEPISFGAFCTVARPHHPDLKQWLGHFFRTRAYRDFVERVAIGININNLRGRDLVEIPIPLAPPRERLRIEAKLDVLTARTARARAELERVPGLVAHYRKAVLSAAFRGELTSAWRRQKPAPDVSIDQSGLFQTPPGWRWHASASIVEDDADIVYGIIQPGPKLTEGVPYVRGTDIQDGRILVDQLLKTSPDIASRYDRSKLKGGDVLLGIIRATKVAVVPDELEGANITQGTARFRPGPLTTTDYLAHWLAGPDAQDWLHRHYRGIDMPGLNLADVRRLPVPVPPHAEQVEIVRVLRSALAEIKRLESEASIARRWLDRLDQAILAKAFRGELLPHDPADEPASVLLDRIRAERAAAPKTKRGRPTSS